MGSVIKYCERCLLINKGKQVMVGKSSEAVDVYKKILANQYDDETKEEEETKRVQNRPKREPKQMHPVPYRQKSRKKASGENA